jgi:phosphatidylethanolamine-binding protein (PEBP) family uncharacterized protein
LQWDIYYRTNPTVSLIKNLWFNLFCLQICPSTHCFISILKNFEQITWDGVPDGTRSIVILADNIDNNAAIHWLAVNIDSRERAFREGQSGRCNWWEMLYRRCPKGRLPASTLEMPNYWGWWRYTGFCPPAQVEQRFRIRVFAQVTSQRSTQFGKNRKIEKIKYVGV